MQGSGLHKRSDLFQNNTSTGYKKNCTGNGKRSNYSGKGHFTGNNFEYSGTDVRSKIFFKQNGFFYPAPHCRNFLLCNELGCFHYIPETGKETFLLQLRPGEENVKNNQRKKFKKNF